MLGGGWQRQLVILSAALIMSLYFTAKQVPQIDPPHSFLGLPRTQKRRSLSFPSLSHPSRHMQGLWGQIFGTSQQQTNWNLAKRALQKQ